MSDTILAEAAPPAMPPMPEASDAHRWLHRLIGRWAATPAEGYGDGAPGWIEEVRAVGDIWVVAEGRGEGPGGQPMTTLVQLGHDPAMGHFVGTWIGSMMNHMWLYTGTLDATGERLTLDCEGPDCGSPGRVARYQDIIAFFDPDHRALISRMEGEDGQWREIMRVDYHRAADARPIEGGRA